MEDISLIMRKSILHGDIACGITWFQQCVASMKSEGIHHYKRLKMIFEKGIQAVGYQRQAIPHAAEDAEPPFLLAKEAGAAKNHTRRGQRKRARRRGHCGKAVASQAHKPCPPSEAVLGVDLERLLVLPLDLDLDRDLDLRWLAEEIFEAQRTAQITRLSTTQAGHRILRDAGIRPIFQPEEKTKLTNDVRKHIKVEQILRNVHPTLNEGRRRDRARALINNAKKHRTHAPFVDAARYNGRQAFAVAVVDIDGTLINAATVQTRHAHEAEEMAIALALQNCRAHSKIYTDSKTAARTFAAGLLARSTAKLNTRIRE
ncbi:hypothetical protein HPB50_028778 [Hyalomma asiaticum]|nr:hypothetical protein HPB50_028778 [Hyalomma asiaticum]